MTPESREIAEFALTFLVVYSVLIVSWYAGKADPPAVPKEARR